MTQPREILKSRMKATIDEERRKERNEREAAAQQAQSTALLAKEREKAKAKQERLASQARFAEKLRQERAANKAAKENKNKTRKNKKSTSNLN